MTSQYMLSASKVWNPDPEKSYLWKKSDFSYFPENIENYGKNWEALTFQHMLFACDVWNDFVDPEQCVGKKSPSQPGSHCIGTIWRLRASAVLRNIKNIKIFSITENMGPQAGPSMNLKYGPGSHTSNSISSKQIRYGTPNYSFILSANVRIYFSMYVDHFTAEANVGLTDYFCTLTSHIILQFVQLSTSLESVYFPLYYFDI